MKRRIEAICCRSKPVNILVVGQTGVGKSTLVNALMGDIVAEVHYWAKPVKPEGMSIFSDTGTETSDDDIPRKEGE